MSASTEPGSVSTARSPIETIPIARPSVTTGRRRTLCSRIMRIASWTVSVGANASRLRVWTSPTLVVAGSRPCATARTAMSRSVRMPRTASRSSTTTTAPMSPSAMSRAASRSVADVETVCGVAVMTSRTCRTSIVRPRGDDPDDVVEPGRIAPMAFDGRLRTGSVPYFVPAA